jgi:hypothetical protein
MGTLKIYKCLHIQNGWKKITVSGNAFERGYQHGIQLYSELTELMKFFPEYMRDSHNMSLEEYINLSNKLARKEFDKCEEWREELEGMVAGALSKGVITNVDFLFAWNMFLSINPESFHSGHCSAFIATGDATKDGKIVMGHNTHCHFAFAPFQNIVQYVRPTKGNPFVMQTGPGLLCSCVDWFLCDSGIIGCETTIGNTNYLPNFKSNKPYFCRIRECMQYAKCLDDCVRIMREDNAGDYPCGWMFGDLNTNEIMLLEVAKTVAEPRRTQSGAFYGSNYAQDQFIRETQTTHGKAPPDLELSSIARSTRLDWLLNNTYWGKLDTRTAKLVISDHYDVYKNKMQMGPRSICKHLEHEPRQDKRPANYPFGAVDGKVVDSKMAKKLAFYGRWGSSCGRVYKPSRTFKRKFPYVPSFRNEPWTVIRTISRKN